MHKVDDYESENLHSIQNNLQNQNVLNRLKVAGKWPPGGHALESKTHSAAAARFRIQIYNLARNMFLQWAGAIEESG